MKVWELIEQLKKMPPSKVIKLDNGQYLDDPEHVEYEEAREYVIIRKK